MNRNILLTSNAYWPSIGGIENSLRHLAQEAAREGDSVKVIVSDIGVPDLEVDRFSTVVDGVEVLRYPIAPLKGFLRKFNFLYSNWGMYLLFRSEYKKNPTAIVIARFHFCALIACWAGFKNVRYLVPSIISHQAKNEKHDNDSLLIAWRRKLFIGWHNCAQKMALTSCSSYVFSETMRKQCLRLSGRPLEKFRLVKPGVDRSRFYPVNQSDRQKLRINLGLPVDKKLVLFVGRFVNAKGVDLLLDAMPKIGFIAHLVLVGAGEELKNYKDKIKKLGISGRVSIISPLRQVEIYYQSADLFVMCSRYEPLGQTLLEAFSSGLPVVAFRSGRGVNTATEELGMNSYVRYATELSSDSLATEIRSALVDLDGPSLRKVISIEAQSKFSWNRLYNLLIRNNE